MEVIRARAFGNWKSSRSEACWNLTRFSGIRSVSCLAILLALHLQTSATADEPAGFSTASSQWRAKGRQADSIQSGQPNRWKTHPPAQPVPTRRRDGRYGSTIAEVINDPFGDAEPTDHKILADMSDMRPHQRSSDSETLPPPAANESNQQEAFRPEFEYLDEEAFTESYKEDCRASRDYLLNRNLTDINLDIGVTGIAGENYPVSCKFDTQQIQLDDFRVGGHGLLGFNWAASGLCHYPLYFNQPLVERNGQSTGLISQPFV
ncbi:MAG: hypothetical protein N2C12_17600, partial [Planctomycetales bacterium]